MINAIYAEGLKQPLVSKKGLMVMTRSQEEDHGKDIGGGHGEMSAGSSGPLAPGGDGEPPAPVEEVVEMVTIVVTA